MSMTQPFTNNILPEQRQHLRFSCAAAADIITTDGRRHLVAEVSTLSRYGCYVDTPDSFDVGTTIRLSLRYNERDLELTGTIIYAHRGWGMGIRFGEVDAAQKARLREWILDLCLKTLSGVRPDALQPTAHAIPIPAMRPPCQKLQTKSRETGFSKCGIR